MSAAAAGVAQRLLLGRARGRRTRRAAGSRRARRSRPRRARRACATSAASAGARCGRGRRRGCAMARASPAVGVRCRRTLDRHEPSPRRVVRLSSSLVVVPPSDAVMDILTPGTHTSVGRPVAHGSYDPRRHPFGGVVVVRSITSPPGRPRPGWDAPAGTCLSRPVSRRSPCPDPRSVVDVPPSRSSRCSARWPSSASPRRPRRRRAARCDGAGFSVVNPATGRRRGPRRRRRAHRHGGQPGCTERSGSAVGTSSYDVRLSDFAVLDYAFTGAPERGGHDRRPAARPSSRARSPTTAGSRSSSAVEVTLDDEVARARPHRHRRCR